MGESAEHPCRGEPRTTTYWVEHHNPLHSPIETEQSSDLHGSATVIQHNITHIDTESLVEFVSQIELPAVTSVPPRPLPPHPLPPHPLPPHPSSTPVNTPPPTTTLSSSQEYQCRWHPEGSDEPCGEALRDRSTFLRHLAVVHGVTGSSKSLITCRLVNPHIGSFCGTQFTRANVPRHVDIHYGLRFPCQHCPKSFSRRRNWIIHVQSKHGFTP
ncbi:hypothetical protein BS17DRAFT_184723 [Gyrodon lividus]|nr:hypothetical protein BS17DRAFT_184723 [Gyrodon lividus]